MKESDLLAIIRDKFAVTLPAGAHGFSDDVAHLPPSDAGKVRVVTCDMIVEEKDFSLTLSSAKSAGHRAVVQNLSDLASAGAVPVGLLWSLALPDSWLKNGAEVLKDFLEGAADVAAVEKVPLFGGDLSSTPGPMVASITAFGDVQGTPLLRSEAQAGDQIWLSRWVGGSACGLRKLLQGQRRHPCVRVHEFPTAELEFGQELVGIATSCMDVSDGLAKDLHRLCRASQLGARLYEDSSFAHPEATLEDALFGGEDYALLFTLARDTSPSRGILLGVMKAEKGVVDGDGQILPDQGYDHFDGKNASDAE
ncbi:MAG: thiamine-phosphate kinase [Deltaproteobacteria bacterium]|nr:thiamine-phosphate kinase [Deltaproteobacteria bacterium]